jgi:hypothetical protein
MMMMITGKIVIVIIPSELIPDKLIVVQNSTINTYLIFGRNFVHYRIYTSKPSPSTTLILSLAHTSSCSPFVNISDLNFVSALLLSKTCYMPYRSDGVTKCTALAPTFYLLMYV